MPKFCPECPIAGTCEPNENVETIGGIQNAHKLSPELPVGCTVMQLFSMTSSNSSKSFAAEDSLTVVNRIAECKSAVVVDEIKIPDYPGAEIGDIVCPALSTVTVLPDEHIAAQTMHNFALDRLLKTQ